MTISRRVFVKSGGLALFSLGLDPLFLARAAYAADYPAIQRSDHPTLVCLFQRGAVDGLNMIVPHGDGLYYRESGTPGVKATADGWLNRYCQHDREHQNTPFRAVAFGPQLPRVLAGSAPSLAIDDLQAFGLRAPQEAVRDRLTRAFEALYEGSATGLLASSSQGGFEARQMLKQGNPGQYQPATGADC